MRTTQTDTIREITHLGVRLRELTDYPDYWAGEDGHIYSTKRGAPQQLRSIMNKQTRIWCVSLYTPGRRYMRMIRGRRRECVLAKPVAVHTLVASVWLEPRPSAEHEIDHRDEDRANNAVTNIHWVTNPQNLALWINKRGNVYPRAKLSPEQVVDILALRWSGRTRVSVAQEYGLYMTTVSKIWSGRSWKHLPR